MECFVLVGVVWLAVGLIGGLAHLERRPRGQAPLEGAEGLFVYLMICALFGPFTISALNTLDNG